MVGIGAIDRVADRYLVRLAVRKVCNGKSFRRRSASLHDLTPEVLEAFGNSFSMHTGRVAFGGLVKRLRQLAQVFTKVPKLWELFKKAIGIESLADIPRAIKNLAVKGYKALNKIIHSVFSAWPLKLYTIEKGKLFGISKLVSDLMKKHPQFGNWLESKAKPRINQFDKWLREKIPSLSRVLLIAVYFWIWFNVVEFEWDMKSLTDALIGNITLAEMLSSLPSSAIGFLLKAFNFGTFTLLPVTVAARLVYLIANRYITWTGQGFTVEWELLSKDIGISTGELQNA